MIVTMKKTSYNHNKYTSLIKVYKKTINNVLTNPFFHNRKPFSKLFPFDPKLPNDRKQSDTPLKKG